MYRRECLEDLDLYGEQHRFIPALLKIRGFQIGEVEVHHRPRQNGHSKYTCSRVIKGFLDLVSVWYWSKYAGRPLHLLGGMSLFFLLGSFICAIWTVAGCICRESFSQIGVSMTLLVVFGISGIIMMVLGLLSERMMKMEYNITGSKPYRIKETLIFTETGRTSFPEETESGLIE